MTIESPPLFGVVPAPQDVQTLPIPNGPYFVHAKKGWMVHKNFHWGRVLTPVAEAETVPDTEPYLWPDINLPIEIIGQAWSFFRKIYELRKSEAMVDITWSEKHGYRLFCPPQTATGGGVKATRKLEHYQGQIVGTIHSHCNFGAFHSGTDTHDADSHDGLHITLGKNMSDQPEMAIMISVGTVRWNFKPAEIWENSRLTEQHYPWWWIPKVTDPKPETKGNWGSDHEFSRPWGQVSTGTARGLGWAEPGSDKRTSLVTYSPKADERRPKVKTELYGSTMFEEYTSLDEFLYMHMEEMDEKEVKEYNDLNEILDGLNYEFGQKGLDFDYTLSPMAGQVIDTRKPQPQTQEGIADADGWIDPRVAAWFD